MFKLKVIGGFLARPTRGGHKRCIVPGSGKYCGPERWKYALLSSPKLLV